MARSTATPGYCRIGVSPFRHRFYHPGGQSGHFMCYSDRTDHELTTLSGFLLDKKSGNG